MLRTGERMIKLLTDNDLLPALEGDEDPTTWSLREILRRKSPADALKRLEFSVFQEVG